MHEESNDSELEDSFLRNVARVDMPLREPKVGQRLGGPSGDRYELREKLGEGGMGWVFRAWDHTLRRTVALKFLFDREDLAETALREAQAIARLSHENIIQIFDMAVWSGACHESLVPFMVVECLDGQPLSALLRQQRLPLRSALQIMRAICAGLVHGIRPAMDVLTRLEAGQVPCSAKIASWRGQVSGEDGAECAQAAAARS
ncbi:MAG TPA: protein kinase, partial [Myxococcaceae bacterium]|nr:protein kinase [Myxococcaceae bacterium]